MAHKNPTKRTVKTAAPAPAAQAAPEPVPPPVRTGPWPWLLLAGLTFLFFWDSFLGGKIFLMRDTFCDCFPWRVFGSQALRSGHLPLWNPYSECGQPYVANPQTAIFYPPHLVFCIFPPIFALKFWMALHVLIGAASMYALARHWRLDPAPALIAGISFGFSTHLISMLEFQSSVAAEVFTPLALLLASMAAETARSAGFQPARDRQAGSLRHGPLVAGLALLYATIYMAGHQQAMINGLFIAGIYLAARCLNPLDPVRLARLGLVFGGAAVLALALCLPQLLLMFELLPLSVRSALFDPGLNQASFHPVWMLGWLFPFLLGHPGYGAQWWGGAHSIFEYWAGAVYVGILPLVCATAALSWLKGARGQGPGANGLSQTGPSFRFLTIVFLGIAVFGLLLAMGKYTPVYMFFYSLPIFDKLRWPSKFLQLVLFAISVLAGLGFQGLLERARAGRLASARLTPIAWGGVFLVLAAGSPFVGRAPGLFTFLTAGAFHHDPAAPQRLAGLAQDWRLAALFLGLTLAVLAPLALGGLPEALRKSFQFGAVALAFINLMIVSRQVHPLMQDDVFQARADEAIVKLSNQEPCRIASSSMEKMQQVLYGVKDPKIYRFATTSLAAETALPQRVFRIHGGDVLTIKDYSRFKNLINDADPWRAKRAIGLLNVHYFLFCPPMGDVMSGKSKVEAELDEIKEALPRALVAGNWRVEPDDSETLKVMLSPEHDPWRTVLLAEAPAGFSAQSAAAAPQPDKPLNRPAEAGVESIRYDWNRVDVTARADRDAVLVLDDVYYPGWQARVDGKPAPILRANFIMRAVMLTAGRHEVSFVYHPTRFYAGLWVSLAGLIVIGALFLIPLRRK